MYAKLQSCIGERKSSLLGACCIILSPKTFGHHFWPSLIPFHKSEGINTRPTPTPGPKSDQLVVTSPMTKLLKIQYLSHLRSKNFQIALVKYYSISNCQKHKKCAKFQLIFKFWIKWNFSKRIVQYSITSHNRLKHYETNSMHPKFQFMGGFPMVSREWQGVPRFGRSQCDK